MIECQECRLQHSNSHTSITTIILIIELKLIIVSSGGGGGKGVNDGVNNNVTS